MSSNPFNVNSTPAPTAQPPNPGLATNAPTGLILATSSQVDDVQVPATVLAQRVDRVAQDRGLSNASRHQLYAFAIQSNPSVADLWLYADMLRNAGSVESLHGLITLLSDRLDRLTNLVRHEWRMTPAQEGALRQLQRHYIVTSKTSYHTLAARSKRYLAQYPLQFSMPAYASEDCVRLAVDRFLERDAHQARSAFRKKIFSAVVKRPSLIVVSREVCQLYSNQAGLDASVPEYIQAHIAQLRLIAADVLAAMPNPASTSNPSLKRLRGDSGFWTAVNHKFKSLVREHGENYNNPGWRSWEASIMQQDAARFSGENEFPAEVVEMFSNPDDFD